MNTLEETVRNRIFDKFTRQNSTETIDKILGIVLKESIEEFPELTEEKVREIFVDIFLLG